MSEWNVIDDERERERERERDERERERERRERERERGGGCGSGKTAHHLQNNCKVIERERDALKITPCTWTLPVCHSSLAVRRPPTSSRWTSVSTPSTAGASTLWSTSLPGMWPSSCKDVRHWWWQTVAQWSMPQSSRPLGRRRMESGCLWNWIPIPITVSEEGKNKTTKKGNKKKRNIWI